MLKSEEIPGVDSKTLLPWRWAESMRSCSLFWIPVNLGSIPRGQREWLLEFFNRLSTRLSEASDLQAEHFMQMQVIDEDEKLRKEFLNAMMKEHPMLGRCWLPRGKQPIPASDQEVELLASKKKEFRPYEYAPQQAWWFLGRDADVLRGRYLGYGGLTFFFRKPDAEGTIVAAPPPAETQMIIPKFLRNHSGLKVLLEDFDPQKPNQIPGFIRNHPAMKQVFSVFDVEKRQEKTKALLSPFRDQTKEIFGAGIPRDLEYEGILFVLPKLASQDFFAQTDQQIRRWFEVFDVYINESPEDQGIILACKDNLTSLIASIVREMRSKGYRYWEG
ncbi:MAG: hypothetical protein PW789_16845 [Edaphobacter sp.]|uniref:hypothetical protein n=1 Tax=Edaphobacter sp. TaxID=1934404 RepID=UPI00239893F7|nr:hypothetical protein [Edaphobacter sp.]MDE1178244.1 hypothetical protein [Edaphobacter sp.]